MTINGVIAQVDELRPNPCPDEAKAAWLIELDGKMAVEVMGLEAPAYGPEDWDRELLVPAPYDNLYPLYLAAMVDYHNQEIDRYNNSMMLYQEALGEFRRWYNRTHQPLGAGGYQHVF